MQMLQQRPKRGKKDGYRRKVQCKCYNRDQRVKRKRIEKEEKKQRKKQR